MELPVQGRDDTPTASHLVATALAPLRASSDPQGLARAVCRLVASTMAVVCRIDLIGGTLPADLVPAGGVVVRSVRPTRPDVVDPAFDCGEQTPGRGSLEVDYDRNLSWIAVPLAAERRTVGSLRVAVDTTAVTAGTAADVRHIAVSVAVALVEAARRHEAVRVSRSLQESLLPHSLPQGPWFEVAARYAPAMAGLQVGGDWYDAQLLGPDELALSVGDVAGHGVEAAARMGEVRSAMTAMRMVCDHPHELIALLHQLYDDSSTFATAICTRLCPSGRFSWSSAGHLHPIVARRGEAVALLEGNVLPPLGAGTTGPVAPNVHRLQPGDTVILYTDGLVERRDEALDVSLRRLLSDIGSAPAAEPDRLLDHVVSARQRSGPTTDDIAVVAARLTGS